MINAYDRLKRERNGTVQKDELKSFVETHFQEGDELEVIKKIKKKTLNGENIYGKFIYFFF